MVVLISDNVVPWTNILFIVGIFNEGEFITVFVVKLLDTAR
jgi:hypothetical protein